MTEISQFQYGKITHNRGYHYGKVDVEPMGKSKEGYNLYEITREYTKEPTVREKNITGNYAELQLENRKYLTQVSEPKGGFFKRAKYFERWIGHGDGTNKQEQGYSKRRKFDVCGHHNDHLCHIEMKEKKDGSFFYTSSFRRENGEIIHRKWSIEAADRSKEAYEKVIQGFAEAAAETVKAGPVSKKTNLLKKLLNKVFLIIK